MPTTSELLRFFSCLEEERENQRYRGTLAQNVPMHPLCTFRIGGNAAIFAAPADIPSLCLSLRMAYAADIPVILVGMGSNVLLPDDGFCGLFITTRGLQKIEINGTYVTAECGSSLNSLILRCAASNLGGLESLYGIPATVGGAAYMNAGAHGTSFGERVVALDVYDPLRDESFVLSGEDLVFSYRQSPLQKRQGLITTRVHLSLSSVDEDTVRAGMRDVINRRAQSQPLSTPSAGSAFLRPQNTSEVWRLVDDLGLRGFRIGGAAISEKHAGFIVNCGGATAKDVRALIAYIQAAVYARHGISLVPEIRIFD